MSHQNENLFVAMHTRQQAAVYIDLLRNTALMLPVSPIKVCKICHFFLIQEKLHNEN